ncbi:MAG: YceH family protein [Bacteroidetes bacterium]|nr:YceH family protein [Bacteroidota bacterium]
MEPQKPIVILDPTEIRVLGSLIEKSKITPDHYPVTVNALTLACNQKSSRNPIVQYDEETVVLALNNLKRKGLISTATGAGSRALKYKHNFAIVYPVNPADLAVLCLLFLRGPLTPGEINSNSARLYEFDSLEEVLQVLEKLSQGDTPFIKQLPRRAGKKEQRFIHLFGEVQQETDEEIQEDHENANTNNLESRIETLEKELSELKSAFEKLLKEWTG